MFSTRMAYFVIKLMSLTLVLKYIAILESQLTQQGSDFQNNYHHYY